MSTPFIPVIKIAVEARDRKVDDDTIYWKRMQQLHVMSQPNHVTSVSTSPRSPFNVAVTSSIRLIIYDTQWGKQVVQYARFKKDLYGATFKHDGSLIACGSADGKARVFDALDKNSKTKSYLRSMKVSEKPLHAVRFSSSGKMLFGMDDEGMLSAFDVGTTGSAPIVRLKAHNDFVRCGVTSNSNDNLVFTGGYDHTVKLWDIRCAENDGPSITMDVGYPAESMILLPNENLLATAAGPIVKVWDLMAGGRLLSSLQSHHKTVTSLGLAQDGSAILSGAIDKRINVWRVSDFSLVHSMSVASPVLGVSMSKNDDTMAVAMGNLLQIQKRAPAKKTAISLDQSDPRSRVRTHAPKPIVQERGGEKVAKEFAAKDQDMLRLSHLDVMLKRYKHHDVIRRIFSGSNYFFSKADLVVPYLRTMIYRNALRGAITGQDVKVQNHLVRFLYKNLFNKLFFDTLVIVVETVLEVFCSDKSLDSKVAAQMNKLVHATTRELTIQKQLNQSIGALELIINSSRANRVKEDVYADEDIFGEPMITSLRLDLETGETIEAN